MSSQVQILAEVETLGDFFSFVQALVNRVAQYGKR